MAELDSSTTNVDGHHNGTDVDPEHALLELELLPDVESSVPSFDVRHIIKLAFRDSKSHDRLRRCFFYDAQRLPRPQLALLPFPPLPLRHILARCPPSGAAAASCAPRCVPHPTEADARKVGFWRETTKNRSFMTPHDKIKPMIWERF